MNPPTIRLIKQSCPQGRRGPWVLALRQIRDMPEPPPPPLCMDCKFCDGETRYRDMECPRCHGIGLELG